MTDTIESLQESIAKDYAALSAHPVFSTLKNMDDLRIFMEMHVFAVWDFMSLLKRLQREYTSMSLPWTPPKNFVAARLINDIVLGEESDDAPNDQHMSHYDLYITGMREVGADTQKVTTFIKLLQEGEHYNNALAKVDAHPTVARFVSHTLNTALNGKTHEVLGAFFYSRENVIPLMFKALLEGWKIDTKTAPAFVFYLERHIQLDTERHGPAAKAIIQEMYGKDEEKLIELHLAAQAAVRERRIFWDGVLTRLQERQ